MPQLPRLLQPEPVWNGYGPDIVVCGGYKLVWRSLLPCSPSRVPGRHDDIDQRAEVCVDSVLPWNTRPNATDVCTRNACPSRHSYSDAGARYGPTRHHGTAHHNSTDWDGSTSDAGTDVLATTDIGPGSSVQRADASHVVGQWIPCRSHRRARCVASSVPIVRGMLQRVCV